MRYVPPVKIEASFDFHVMFANSVTMLNQKGRVSLSGAVDPRKTSYSAGAKHLAGFRLRLSINWAAEWGVSQN